jgi:enoyl-CoA hydratase
MGGAFPPLSKETPMSEPLVLTETPSPGVTRLTMNRPGAKNAQNLDLLYALDDAFTACLRDTEVKVIILAGAGSDFSTGHDLRTPLDREEPERFRGHSTAGNYAATSPDGYMAREEEAYFELCQRWRNLTKPTIAQVQGRCMASGLMLAWVCDLIIASEDATFVDPVSAWGANGLEWFAYPWEFGPRKAKEFLFTGDTWTAEEAWRLGMVNHVAPRHELPAFTEALAARIANKPAFALKTAKQSVNAAMDAQGQHLSLQMAFQIHHLTHNHNRVIYDGQMVDPALMPRMWAGKKTES